MDSGGGGVCALEASEEPLLSQPYWEEPLVQRVRALPRNGDDTKESSLLFYDNKWAEKEESSRRWGLRAGT